MNSTRTLREQLTTVGLNWDKFLIIYHELSNWENPGWHDDEEIKQAFIISNALKLKFSNADTKNHVISVEDHPILDEEYSIGYGAPECPSFIARDWNDDGTPRRCYFPVQYDGSTYIDYIEEDLEKYLTKNEDGYYNSIPYPGG